MVRDGQPAWHRPFGHTQLYIRALAVSSSGDTPTACVCSIFKTSRRDAHQRYRDVIPTEVARQRERNGIVSRIQRGSAAPVAELLLARILDLL